MMNLRRIFRRRRKTGPLTPETGWHPLGSTSEEDDPLAEEPRPRGQRDPLLAEAERIGRRPSAESLADAQAVADLIRDRGRIETAVDLFDNPRLVIAGGEVHEPMPGFVGQYGEDPVDLGEYLPAPRWDEFMHYLYLPVRLPASEAVVPTAVVLPERLEFLREAVERAMYDAAQTTPHLDDPYVYVTARRGFATPGNPLNRPGWHCDDFGGTDLNYVWTDAFPTLLLHSEEPLPLSEDDAQSMVDMEGLAKAADSLATPDLAVRELANGHLHRLTPWVIHNTPTIPAPGGMRSFFKISVSTHRYNLLGNSHNHLLDYDWRMYDRAEVRNQPGGNGDYIAEVPS